MTGIGWILTVLVVAGAIPAICSVIQVALAAVHHWFSDTSPNEARDLPRIAVLVPAWNEANVLAYSIDALLALDYPPERLRVVVIDDASTDMTPRILRAKVARYGDRLVTLRRNAGGLGKAHTLNHGLARVLADDWAEAILITDADVMFAPTALRMLARHFTDPTVGAVTGFIREASSPANWMSRYIGFEYSFAQLVGRRAQNVLGAQACLAGGLQLHTRTNLVAMGGRIDGTTLAEDTVTTFLTQLGGRRVVFDPAALCFAEEPSSVAALWHQRMRWARGNIQVARRFRSVFFHRRGDASHRLGSFLFGLIWFSTLLLPAAMVLTSASLITLAAIDSTVGIAAFRLLWIACALAYILVTTFTLLLELKVARHWRHAIAYPGLANLGVIVWALAPGVMTALARALVEDCGLGWGARTRLVLRLIAYSWGAVSLILAWAIYRLDVREHAPAAISFLVLIVGYGPLLCAVTFGAYVAEARHANATWTKTVKSGKLATVTVRPR